MYRNTHFIQASTLLVFSISEVSLVILGAQKLPEVHWCLRFFVVD